MAYRLRPIIVADADCAHGAAISSILRSVGFVVGESTSPRDAMVLDAPVVIVGIGGRDARVARALMQATPPKHAPFIVVVSCGSEALAVAAFRAGASDYFSEPFEAADLIAAVRRRLTHATAPSLPSVEPAEETPLIGYSAAMQRIQQYIIRLAGTDTTVLITGETGTGKELAAALIHHRSERRRRRFVSVNCAAIPEGLFESELFGYERGAFTGSMGSREGHLQLADGGTLFFDEIGDMGLPAQAKILRAIETHEVWRLGARRGVSVNFRVVAATNQPLEDCVERGVFRRDLFFRLNVARIHLPPLRERREDIPALIAHFLRELNGRCRAAVEGFTPAALRALESYAWPGNIRELKNMLEALLIDDPPARIDVQHLPRSFTSPPLPLATEGERGRVLAALAATNWNKSRAAEKLRWSRMTLYRKLVKYQIANRESPRPDDEDVTPSPPPPPL